MSDQFHSKGIDNCQRSDDEVMPVYSGRVVLLAKSMSAVSAPFGSDASVFLVLKKSGLWLCEVRSDALTTEYSAGCWGIPLPSRSPLEGDTSVSSRKPLLCAEPQEIGVPCWLLSQEGIGLRW